MPLPVQITPDIRLIRAANPGPMTGSGTNTYILGHGAVTVIDPGPDLDSHLEAVLATGECVTDILLTHAHLDHSALSPRLVAVTGAVTHAFGRAGSGRSALMQRLAAEGLSGGEGADLSFQPDDFLADGASLALNGLAVEVLHTPGHMGCHLSFALGDTLFSGDNVMGWSTSLISPPDGDMAAYIASLHRLAARRWRRFLPGHGDPVDDPAERLTTLIAHRRAREAAILSALRDSGPANAPELAALVYHDIAPALLPVATRNTLAHLIDLWSQNRAEPGPGLLATARFTAL